MWTYETKAELFSTNANHYVQRKKDIALTNQMNQKLVKKETDLYFGMDLNPIKMLWHDLKNNASQK